jgi:membrane protease YdiL (CAAX protease family)
MNTRAIRPDGGTSQSFDTNDFDGWLRPTERFSIATAIAVVVPTAGIVLSEWLLYVDSVRPALWGYVATLLLCTLLPLRYDGETTIFGAFALVPVFRLVNLGMPVFFDVTLLWLPLIYGPLIVAVYLVARGRMPELAPGWKWAIAGAPIALPVAYVLATIEYDIVQPTPLVPTLDPLQVLAIAGVMIAYVALLEEMLFRGVLQRVLERRTGRVFGLLLTSALFGAMHSGYGSSEELAFAAAIGLVFGVVYDITDSLALVTVMHGALNVFLYAVIPLQGSLIDVPI